MSAVQTLEEVKESKCNEKPRHIRFWKRVIFYLFVLMTNAFLRPIVCKEVWLLSAARCLGMVLVQLLIYWISEPPG